MANYFPLIVETAGSNTINQLPAGDFLDLSESGIANSGNITMNSAGVINAGNITRDDLTDAELEQVRTLTGGRLG